jgi:hypothetical protein
MVVNHYKALERWVAECLIGFCDAQTLIAQLMAQGLTQEEAQTLVHEVSTHPYIQAGRSMVKQYQRLEWLLGVYEKNHQQSAHWGTVERRSDLTREAFFENYYAVNRPVILTGCLEGSPALTQWTPEYLKSRWGHLEVEYHHYQSDDTGENALVTSKAPFSQYVEMVQACDTENAFYLNAYSKKANQHLIQEMIQEVHLPEAFLDPQKIDGGAALWYGPANTNTELHIDILNGFLVQVQGRKRVRMIPSYYLPSVYPKGDMLSLVSAIEPDYETYPRFKQAQIVEFILEPGEIYFNPIGSWHQVTALDKSISFTCTHFYADNQYPWFSEAFPESP